MEESKPTSVFLSATSLSLIFLGVLIVFETFFLSQDYSTFVVTRHYNSRNYTNIFAFVMLGLLSVGLSAFFFWSSFASAYKFRLIYFLIFCLAVFWEYSYQNAFQRFSNLEDMENAVIAADFFIRMNAVSLYFSWLALIPCLVYAVLLFLPKPVLDKNSRVLLVNIVVFLIFCSITAYYTPIPMPKRYLKI
jgi:hypothetical protein